MERIIGNTEVTDIDNGFIVRMGAVAAQRDKEQLTDLLHLCANALGFVVVGDEDMKKLVMTIDPNHAIPLKNTTHNNNAHGKELHTTEEWFELNENLKHS